MIPVLPHSHSKPQEASYNRPQGSASDQQHRQHGAHKGRSVGWEHRQHFVRQFAWKGVGEEQQTQQVVGLLPALLTSRLRLKP